MKAQKTDLEALIVAELFWHCQKKRESQKKTRSQKSELVCVTNSWGGGRVDFGRIVREEPISKSTRNSSFCCRPEGGLWLYETFPFVAGESDRPWWPFSCRWSLLAFVDPVPNRITVPKGHGWRTLGEKVGSVRVEAVFSLACSWSLDGDWGKVANLSCGQRQRGSLAKAVWNDADLCGFHSSL